jgi:hypothetical protein
MNVATNQPTAGDLIDLLIKRFATPMVLTVVKRHHACQLGMQCNFEP